MTSDMKDQTIYNEAINGDEGFTAGDGYPSCDGEPCANVADEASDAADTMSAHADEPAPADVSDAGEAGDESGIEEGAREESCDPHVKEAAEWKDKYLRLQAEFDNYRKRTLREKMELVERGGQEVLKAMLPVADDLDRALDAMRKSDDLEALRSGMELIAQKFAEALRARGIAEIEAKGRPFDADRHEAVARFAAGKEHTGKVVDVVQKGYMLGDKVLRFAKVVVGE